jgi:hypothetical protein
MHVPCELYNMRSLYDLTFGGGLHILSIALGLRTHRFAGPLSIAWRFLCLAAVSFV